MTRAADRAGSRTQDVEMCLVPVCNRLADTRGLCKRHYLSLSRSLKKGEAWNMQTGKPTLSGYKPVPPAPPAPPPDEPTVPVDVSDAALGKLDRETLAAVRHQVEIDAARLLPTALAWCLGRTLLNTGLANNPEAVRAFSESVGIQSVDRGLPSPQGSPRRRNRVPAT